MKRLERAARALGVLLALCWSGPAAAAVAPFLWEVEGPKSRHWLLGSVHLLPADAYPLPAVLDAAYAQAATVVFETDPAALGDPAFQQALVAGGRSQTGLRGEIDAALYATLQSGAAALQLPVTLCDGFKAWFCALALENVLMLQEGIRPDAGLDLHYFGKARADGRRVRWLESPQAQVELFAGMPRRVSAALLASTLEDLAEPGRGPAQIIAQWRQGDIEGLEQLVRELYREHPGVYWRLLAERNLRWMASLDIWLRSATPHLIVVGAAHLVGEHGLPMLLAERGLPVRAVRCESTAAPAAVCGADAASRPRGRPEAGAADDP